MAQLIDQCREMSLPIHIRLPLESIGAKSFVEKVGGYTVLTTTRNYATPLQLAGAGNQSPRIRRDHEDHAGTVQI